MEVQEATEELQVGPGQMPSHQPPSEASFKQEKSLYKQHSQPSQRRLHTSAARMQKAEL
jgi:hypothetical protein